MKTPAKESALERRLRELQEQSSALQGDIKSLNKSLKKIGALDESGNVAVAQRPPRAPSANQPSRLNPAYASSVGTGTTTSVAVTNQHQQPEDNEAEVNLFTVAQADQPRNAPPVPETIFPPTASDTVAPAPRYRRAAPPFKPQKLANYLASGSFGGNVPMSHERKIQRIRAIISVIAAITFAYVICRSLFR